MTTFDYSDLETLAYALPEDVLQRKMAGDFDGAQALIDGWLSRDINQGLRRRLMLEKEIIRQLPFDYPDSFEECYEKVQKVLPDMTAERFRELQKNGRIDWIYVHGQERFFDSVTDVLLDDSKMKHHSDVLLGKVKGEEDYLPLSPSTKMVHDAVHDMQETGLPLSYRFRIRTAFRLKDEVFRPGHIRIWLPVPRSSEQIYDIRIVDVSGQNHILAPEDAAQRTICFDTDLEKNEEFFVEYEWVTCARYIDLWKTTGNNSSSNAAAGSAQETDVPAHNLDSNKLSQKGNIYNTSHHPVYPDHSPAPSPADLTEQLPHIQFTPYMRALADEIAGNITDPLEKARAFYNYITTKVKYSYVRTYFTIEMLSEYAAIGHKGDCGIQALMFITLCRIAGIPARWQSSLETSRGIGACHDWAQFWTKEYGWLFCDPSYGGGAFDAGDEKRRRFYFGNLDPFRMVANNTFQAQFAPIAPRFLRNDPYDNQIGEAEFDDRKIYNNEFETTRKVTLMEKIN